MIARPIRLLRIYADTSVIGGCLDAEFATYSNRLVQAVAAGKHKMLISEVVVRELSGAPAEVRSVLASIPDERSRGCAAQR